MAVFSSREPTWFDTELRREWAESEVEDVFLAPEDAPPYWWNALGAMPIDTFHVQTNDTLWEAWARRVYADCGLQRAATSPYDFFDSVVREGLIYVADPASTRGMLQHLPVPVSVSHRLTAIETLLDIIDAGEESIRDFADRVNDRARLFRVGVRLEGRRFVSVVSEHMHDEVVRPALLLLSDERFADVDALYRKAFDRLLHDDPAGTVTAATSAIEEMLRLGLDVEGFDLDKLAEKARSAHWIATAGVAQMIRKLYALRRESDAHTSGTERVEVAQFSVHVSGSVLIYLGATFPEPVPESESDDD